MANLFMSSLTLPCHKWFDYISTDFPLAVVFRVLGNVAEIQNFLRITKINLWSNLATRERGVHLHTIVDRDAEVLQERR